MYGHSSATSDPRCRQRQDPESLCGSSITAGFSAGISHGYLCPQRHNATSTGLLLRGQISLAAPQTMRGGFCRDLGITLAQVKLPQPSIVCRHYCLSVNLKHVTCGRPLSVCLALVAWLIAQTNVLYLDDCLSYCKVHSMMTKHNMLPMPPCKPSG